MYTFYMGSLINNTNKDYHEIAIPNKFNWNWNYLSNMTFPHCYNDYTI